MTSLVGLFLSGFVLVALTAANVRLIANYQLGGTFLCSMAISAVWFGNTRAAVRSTHPAARWAYAVGTGCGSVVGLWLIG